jgi:hypothetical protein
MLRENHILLPLLAAALVYFYFKAYNNINSLAEITLSGTATSNAFIVTGYKIYTSNRNQPTATGFAVKDGVFVDVGDAKYIESKYPRWPKVEQLTSDPK